jgi:hypothetical protein
LVYFVKKWDVKFWILELGKILIINTAKV